jgi:phosphoenolpyruvate carboxylase
MNFIKDPILGEYCVQIDEYNYTAIRTITPESGIKYDHTIGHYDTLGRALKKIADNMMKDKSYDSLKEFIAEYDQITNKFIKNFL